jgi:hypothetical protein
MFFNLRTNPKIDIFNSISAYHKNPNFYTPADKSPECEPNQSIFIPLKILLSETTARDTHLMHLNIISLSRISFQDFTFTFLFMR